MMNEKEVISGPYKATKLWNNVVRSFYKGMPVTRHWRGLRQYDNCFSAADAIDYLQQQLHDNPNFGCTVTREQTVKLLRKFVKAGLIEDTRGNAAVSNDFHDGRELYRFSSRSPLKALRTPRTPGRPILAQLNTSDNGSTPMRRQTCKEVGSPLCSSSWKSGLPKQGIPRLGMSARRAISCVAFSGKGGGSNNTINEGRHWEGGMTMKGSEPDYLLVARKLGQREVEEAWKEVLLSQLENHRLRCANTFPISLHNELVRGDWVHHNVTQVTDRGVVQVASGHPDDLPSWILTAMKCLAHWPNSSDTLCNLPNYPGVEKDVYKMVKEFFTNMTTPLIPFDLYETFVSVYISAEFVDIQCRSPPSLSVHQGASFHSSPADPSLNISVSDSVEDLLLDMSACSGQKTSTPNGPNGSLVGLQGSPLSQNGSPIDGPNKGGQVCSTPSVKRSSLNSSCRLHSLKLCRLKHYTDFKDSSLYPKSPSERCRISSGESKSSNTNTGVEIHSDDITDVILPPNSCFETAFTSDSPRTRIIPQQSVDSIHLRQHLRLSNLARQRPKSIAVTTMTRSESCLPRQNCQGQRLSCVDELDASRQTLSPMNRSRSAVHLSEDGESVPSSSAESSGASNATRSLASRVRDSIRRKTREDFLPSRRWSRKHSLAGRSLERTDVSCEGSLQSSGQQSNHAFVARLRTHSGGYANPMALSVFNDADDDEVKTIAGKMVLPEKLFPQSVGRNNLMINQRGRCNSVDINRDSFDRHRPITSLSDSHLLDHHATDATVDNAFLDQKANELQSNLKRPTPDACLTHSMSCSSMYMSAVSHLSRTNTPCVIQRPEVPPRMSLPQGGNSRRSVGEGKLTTLANEYVNLASLSPTPCQSLSQSARELSDNWADRTPYGQTAPYAPGGVWQLYNSSPRLLTREGKDTAVNALQLLLLLLNPVARRKCHLLLRMMSKMAANERLSLDAETSTRALVLQTFTRSLLLCRREYDYDESLCVRVVSFLMDCHEELFRVPSDMAVLAHRHIAQLERNQIVYVPVSEAVMYSYCRQVTEEEFQKQKDTGTAMSFLMELLEQIVADGKLSAKEKKKKLKEFKNLYPDVYLTRFPEASESKVSTSRVRSLMKFASLSSLGKKRSLRV